MRYDSRPIRNDLNRKKCKVSQVGGCIESNDKKRGDEDGFRKVSKWVLKFRGNAIEVVPPIITPQCRVKSEGKVDRRRRIRLRGWVL